MGRSCTTSLRPWGTTPSTQVGHSRGPVTRAECQDVMDGRCTVTSPGVTSSTTTTGAPAWALTGWCPPTITLPRWDRDTGDCCQALVTSPNLEHQDSVCADSVHSKAGEQPFLVVSPLGWLEDSWGRGGPSHSWRLNLYKSKLRKANDHNRNVVIYNY